MPWRFDIDTALVFDESDRVIADVDDLAGWRAKGRLIAAAPVLLEAAIVSSSALLAAIRELPNKPSRLRDLVVEAKEATEAALSDLVEGRK